MARTKNRIGPDDLGIDLASRSDPELFDWLVCCSLFTKPIAQEIAADALGELRRERLDRLNNLREASWDDVVAALHRASYTRYQESTATQLIDTAKLLHERYGGSLNRLHDEAESRADLARRLQEFNGIGEKGAQIFLRELSGVWEKA
ncbi:MAG TPA: hypothetical protein VE088_03710 [Gaiellaceae bacterium]|nr:hypothetical protein [Gaiellaceae bacterium]